MLARPAVRHQRHRRLRGAREEVDEWPVPSGSDPLPPSAACSHTVSSHKSAAPVLVRRAGPMPELSRRYPLSCAPAAAARAVAHRDAHRQERLLAQVARASRTSDRSRDAQALGTARPTGSSSLAARAHRSARADHSRGVRAVKSSSRCTSPTQTAHARELRPYCASLLVQVLPLKV